MSLTFMDNLDLSDFHPFWLSLILHSGEWVWQLGEQVTFLNWKKGQPDQCCPKKEATHAASESGVWSDTSPLSKAAVICKYRSKLPELR